MECKLLTMAWNSPVFSGSSYTDLVKSSLPGLPPEPVFCELELLEDFKLLNKPFEDLKSGIPLAQLIPAPVTTTILREYVKA
ncbi:hypothetical protein WICPIJ_003699 [Wickerhamomyces pijperi]|uniref:Uncharacterized protein n=1 Tax=Wickerhamomyces pijperi TaxID=599730 RepID=A0A9P8Q973_WICPI|nr:hypothetical protein WICPIJ_003699 [Wickerhamomyces pijperi]